MNDRRRGPRRCGAFRVNAVPYDETATDSVVNALGGHWRGPEAMMEHVRRLHERFGHDRTSLAAFTEVFGRQQTTVTYTRRNRVWTFTRDGVTVWALVSVEGVAWEWPGGDATAAAALIRDIEDVLSGTAVPAPA